MFACAARASSAGGWRSRAPVPRTAGARPEARSESATGTGVSELVVPASVDVRVLPAREPTGCALAGCAVVAAVLATGVACSQRRGSLRAARCCGRRARLQAFCEDASGESNGVGATVRPLRRARRRGDGYTGVVIRPPLTPATWASRDRGRSDAARAARRRGSPTAPARGCGSSTPLSTSAPSESEACSEPWLPPPTWAWRPQSMNS